MRKNVFSPTAEMEAAKNEYRRKIVSIIERALEGGNVADTDTAGARMVSDEAWGIIEAACDGEFPVSPSEVDVLGRAFLSSGRYLFDVAAKASRILGFEAKTNGNSTNMSGLLSEMLASIFVRFSEDAENILFEERIGNEAPVSELFSEAFGFCCDTGDFSILEGAAERVKGKLSPEDFGDLFEGYKRGYVFGSFRSAGESFCDLWLHAEAFVLCIGKLIFPAEYAEKGDTDFTGTLKFHVGSLARKSDSVHFPLISKCLKADLHLGYLGAEARARVLSACLEKGFHGPLLLCGASTLDEMREEFVSTLSACLSEKKNEKRFWAEVTPAPSNGERLADALIEAAESGADAAEMVSLLARSGFAESLERLDGERFKRTKNAVAGKIDILTGIAARRDEEEAGEGAVPVL